MTVPISKYRDTPFVIIREVEGSRGVKAGSYWVAPVLPDRTLGPIFPRYLTDDLKEIQP